MKFLEDSELNIVLIFAGNIPSWSVLKSTDIVPVVTTSYH